MSPSFVNQSPNAAGYSKRKAILASRTECFSALAAMHPPSGAPILNVLHTLSNSEEVARGWSPQHHYCMACYSGIYNRAWDNS